MPFRNSNSIYMALLTTTKYSKYQHAVLANELRSVFNQITKWMASHYLLLNPGKTEIIFFGCQSTLSNLKITGTFLTQSLCIRFVSTVKNLGFWLDSNLSFKHQITTLKSSCFHKLRNLSKMKPHLLSKQLKILTQALVISSLDYCNSLYYGINASLLAQLRGGANTKVPDMYGGGGVFSGPKTQK